MWSFAPYLRWHPLPNHCRRRALVKRLGDLDGGRDEAVPEDALLPHAAEDGPVEAAVAQDAAQPARHKGQLGVAGHRVPPEQLLRPLERPRRQVTSHLMRGLVNSIGQN